MKATGFAVAVLVLCLDGCSLLGPGASVTVLLPPLPAHWAAAFPGMWYLVVFPDGSGQVQRLKTGPVESCVALSCSKNGNTPLLAYPMIAGEEEADAARPGSFRPGGGLFPSSLTRGDDGLCVPLTWQDGPVALVIFRLLSAGMDVSMVNAARLSEYLGRAKDPWEIDLERVTERLARGEFSAYDIDPLPRRSVTLGTGPGTWFLESPFRPAMPADTGGTLQISDLPLGLHTLFSSDGGRIRLTVGRSDLVVLRSDGEKNGAGSSRRRTVIRERGSLPDSHTGPMRRLLPA